MPQLKLVPANDAAAAANNAPMAQGATLGVLHFDSGGPNYTSMDITDAKIAAAEARTDTKFAELRGDLKAISAATSGIKSTIIGTGVAIAAIILAAMAYGGQMFGIGMDNQAVAERAALAVEQRYSDRNEATIERLNAATVELSHALAALRAEASSAPSQ